MPKYTVQNDHPVPCVDVIVLNDQDEILLVKRTVEPFRGRWSIVGRRMEVTDNNIETTAVRGVKEETGLDAELVNLVDVLASNTEISDHRFFVVQTVYTAKVIKGASLHPTNEADEFRWVPLDAALSEILAFNHNQILQVYKTKKERGKLLSVKRRFFSDNFVNGFVYGQNMYPRFGAKAIILNEKKEILLAERSQPPFTGAWDLPGGHMLMNETVEETLKRELREELGVDSEMGELFQVYSDKGHQPKSAVVVAFYFTKVKSQVFFSNIEMRDFKYWPLTALPAELAYRHEVPLADIRDWVEKNLV